MSKNLGVVKSNEPGAEGPLCPELPAIMGAKDALGRAGFILMPCIGDKCAKYLGCQVVPKLAEAFYKQNIITGPRA